MDTNRFDVTTVFPDGRDTLPNWLWINADDCHALAMHSLPPVPLIAIGDRAAPGAALSDMVAKDSVSCAALGRAIDAAPSTSAAIIQCLRVGAFLPPLAALTLESATMAALQGSAEHRSWLAAHRPLPHDEPGEVVVSRTDRRLDVRLQRPAALNAIDRGLRDALFDAFSLAVADTMIDTIRLTAEGRAFSIGADLSEFGTTRDPVTAHLIRLRTLPVLPLLRRPGRFEVHVQGACVGSGLELAAFADHLTAAPNAWFHLPELAMGILPGFGGTVSIPSRIGRQRTAEFLISGRRITARAALAIGLVDRIMDDPPGDDRGTHVFGG